MHGLQAAREIAHTIASSANKVYLSSETLLLNVVSGVHDWQHRGCMQIAFACNVHTMESCRHVGIAMGTRVILCAWR